MRKATLFILISVLLSLLLVGCLPIEEEVLPAPTLLVPEPDIFRTIPVEIGDVVLYQDLRTVLVAAREEVLSFPMNGILIDTVHVRLGDAVEEGDILIELERSAYLQELERVSRELEMAKVSLRQLDEMHSQRTRWAQLTNTSVDTFSYRRQRDDISHRIEVINIQINNLEDELERRVLRASMDGYVTFLHRVNEGDVTIAEARMVAIADIAETVFLVSDSGAQLLSIGDIVDITIRPDVYQGVVIDPVEHNITANRGEFEAFILIQEGFQYGFTTRTSGLLRVIINTAENVLTIPERALHTFEGHSFVFVLEDDLRVMRSVEVGLIGNFDVEIIGGLAEGELVIIE